MTKQSSRSRSLFTLASIALTLSSTGCLSSPFAQDPPAQTTNVQQITPASTTGQQFGQSPEGFIQNPNDPTRGWVPIGGNMIAVNRGPTGWEAEQGAGSQPRSIMNTTPDRYDPMVNFLQRNRLSLKDWNTLGEAYAATEVVDQKAETRVNFLRSLDETIQNAPPQNLNDAIQNAKHLRMVLNQLR
jgi:hypothetical protein